jgi:DNA invertase Pin-like site-specific DNA recombinase
MPAPSAQSIRYIAYVRKSTEGDEKQALSIDSQKAKIAELFPHLDILDTIEERRSAFSPNRPAFAALLDCIRKRDAQGIVAWHPDRLSRNELDAATLTYMIRTGVIQDLKFGSYHFDNSPEGIMMLQMALSHSQYFSAKLSKDVVRGMARKAELGWLPSVAPPGYLNTPDRGKGFKIVVKDPERFPLIRKMWELMLTGRHTPPQILRIATQQWGYRTLPRRKLGNKPMSRSMLYAIFRDPFYYGWFDYPRGSGNWHRGKHEPMVTREEFERVGLRLGGPVRRMPQRRTFAFTGLIRCGECGCGVTAEEKRHAVCSACQTKFSCLHRTDCPTCGLAIAAMRNPAIRQFTYYHCTKKKEDVLCSQKAISRRELERQIDEFLSGIEIDGRYVEWAIRRLRSDHQRESKARRGELRERQEAFRAAAAKLDALLEMRLSGEITEEEYKRKKGELLGEKTRQEELLSDAGGRQTKWLDACERTFRFASLARRAFAEGDANTKRAILTTLGSNLVLRDGNLSIQAEKPFSILASCLKSASSVKRGFEPVKSRIDRKEIGPSDALRPAMLSRSNEVRTFFIEHPNFAVPDLSHYSSPVQAS